VTTTSPPHVPAYVESLHGPLVFIMYTSPLSTLISSLSLNHHLYADDTQLDFSTVHIIGTSLVHSKIDYCNSLYYGLPKTKLTRLQHIQNSLPRAVVAAPRSSDSDQILKSLHWLKVHERIEYKIISTTYKVLQSSSPHYLRDIIAIQPSRSTRRHWSLSFTHSSVESQNH